jgi:hypothetical protein
VNEEDTKVISAMLRYGGSFVQALAKAAQQADAENLQKIKDAFDVYWAHYKELADA